MSAGDEPAGCCKESPQQLVGIGGLADLYSGLRQNIDEPGSEPRKLLDLAPVLIRPMFNQDTSSLGADILQLGEARFIRRIEIERL